MATPTVPETRRRRGADSAHSDDALLDLVALVARAAIAQPSEQLTAPARISMPAFNRVKVTVDRARAVTDPKDPERIPSAEAIHLRFNKDSARKVSWLDIVTAALLADRAMWLSALRRNADVLVTPPVLVHALQYVAHQLGTVELGREEYRRKRDELAAADRARFGDDALLAELLPTLNQIEGQHGWGPALTAAGLNQGAQVQSDASAQRSRAALAAGRQRGRGYPRLSLAHAIACYAALNGSWPSRTALRAFANHSKFALPDFKHQDWAQLIAQARALLDGEGVPAPAGERSAGSGGRGKRLSVLYPVNGILSATEPTVSSSHPSAGKPGGAEPQQVESRVMQMRALCVIGLRVWLSGLSSRESRARAAYLQWAGGTDWPAPSTVARHGGFATLKREAEEQNTRDRRQQGTPVPAGTLARATMLKASLHDAGPSSVPVAPELAPGTPPEPTFGQVLLAVLAGPHDSVQPPKQ